MLTQTFHHWSVILCYIILWLQNLLLTFPNKSRSSSSKETRATAVDLLFLSMDVAKLSASVRMSSKFAFFLPSLDSFDSSLEKSESSTTGVPPVPVSFVALNDTLPALPTVPDTLRASPTKDNESWHATATQRKRTTLRGSKHRLPSLQSITHLRTSSSSRIKLEVENPKTSLAKLTFLWNHKLAKCQMLICNEDMLMAWALGLGLSWTNQSAQLHLQR